MENIIECFTMFSFSSTSYLAQVAMGKIVSGQYGTGQTKAYKKNYILLLLHMINVN